MTSFATIFLAAVLLLLSPLVASDSQSNNNNDFLDPNWYTAYSTYPEYCSTPEMMAQRSIPPLKEDESNSRMGETRLVHVTAVIRHGARTPVGAGQTTTCWDGYWDDPATGVWDCDLKLEMAPPTPHRYQEQAGISGSTSAGASASASASDNVVLFEKHYDALQDKNDNLANGLFGTCQTGQLLTRGYAQHVTNGQILRDAYCYDSATYDHNVKMRLIDVNMQQQRPWNAPQIYLRSDDDSRVLLSGQVLLRSMLEPEIDQAVHQRGEKVTIPVHLADYDRDVIGVNSKVCPRLTELRTNVERSPIFLAFNNSNEAKEIRNFMTNELKVRDDSMDIMGCLLPTVCTDRPLPEAFDYGNSDMFERMIEFVSA